MTFSWCKSKKTFLWQPKIPKATELKKCLKFFFMDLGLYMLILFVFNNSLWIISSNWCFQKILLVNSFSNQMLRLWYKYKDYKNSNDRLLLTGPKAKGKFSEIEFFSKQNSAKLYCTSDKRRRGPKRIRWKTEQIWPANWNINIWGPDLFGR